MCRPASFVIDQQGKVYWLRSLEESHEVIIEAFNLGKFDLDPRNVQLVRVEVVPPNGNNFDAPLDDWRFIVDQDILPIWWDREWGEEVARKELGKWVDYKIVRPGEVKNLEDRHLWAIYGNVPVLKNCKVQMVHGHIGTAYRSDIDVVYDDGYIELVADYSSVNVVKGKVRGVHITGSVVLVENSGVVEVVGNGASIWEMQGSVTNVLYGGVIYNLSGGIVESINGGVVFNMEGGQINMLEGNATIQRMKGGTVKKLAGGVILATNRIANNLKQNAQIIGADSYVLSPSGIIQGD